MDKVTFMDSSACAVPIAAFKDVQLKPERLILVTSPVVQSLIELTWLHTIFKYCRTKRRLWKHLYREGAVLQPDMLDWGK